MSFWTRRTLREVVAVIVKSGEQNLGKNRRIEKIQ